MTKLTFNFESQEPPRLTEAMLRERCKKQAKKTPLRTILLLVVLPLLWYSVIGGATALSYFVLPQIFLPCLLAFLFSLLAGAFITFLLMQSVVKQPYYLSFTQI